MVNPTGGKIRSDKAGIGLYGAPRGNRRHRGLDFLCDPGQPVFAPVGGRFRRIANPYSGDPKYTGMCIQNDRVEIKLFYLSPAISVGDKFKAGDTIAFAQDISKKYGKDMKPHIHLEISNIDPMFLYKIVGEL